MKDPYQILGVSKTASQDEIKNAYRGLAKKLHPDLNPGNKTAEAKFKDIASAYEMIGSAEARGKFDRGETAEQQAEQQQSRGPYYNQTQQNGGRYGFNFGGDSNAEDIFADLFGQGGRSRGGRSSQGSMDFPGEDQLYQMEVEFKDSILGGEREITLPSGKRLQVKIPAGIDSGAKLRFKGMGGAGVGRGAAGDAYVEIKVRPHAQGFRRVGQNVEAEVPVSFIEALTGGEIQVPTLDGSVKLTVPPGVNTGSRLRIRGKGVASSKEPGDQIVILKIMLPKKVDPALQEAVRAWGGKFSYDPRSEA